jgi:hypothetical protein
MFETEQTGAAQRVTVRCLDYFQQQSSNGEERQASPLFNGARHEFAIDQTIVASHLRLTNRSKISYDWQHYLALAQRNPAALRSPAFFADMSAPLVRWRLGLSALIDTSFGPAVATK